MRKLYIIDIANSQLENSTFLVININTLFL
jgi:hypothetical protein